MAITYESIATTTVSGSSTSSVSFTGISGTYTDIVFVCATDADNGSASTRIRLNSDTGSNYSFTDMRGDGSSTSSASSANQAQFSLGVGTATNLTQVYGTLFNYSNSTTYKTITMRANNSVDTTLARTGLWRNTNAITAIEFSVSVGIWLAGSTFTLYGIKAA